MEGEETVALEFVRFVFLLQCILRTMVQRYAEDPQPIFMVALAVSMAIQLVAEEKKKKINGM